MRGGRALGVALSMTWIAALLAGASPAQAAFPGANGKIAFERATDPQWILGDIWVMNPDGTGEIRLTNAPEDDMQPFWSPDGSGIAFSSYRPSPSGLREVYVMNGNGSGQVRLTERLEGTTEPSWAPDMSLLLASCGEVRFDGSGCHPRPDTGNDTVWSPDGSTLAFWLPPSEAPSKQGIYTSTPGTPGVTRLTQGLDSHPDWSPDSERLVFAGSDGLYFASPGTPGATPVPGSVQADSEPVWSPDGEWLAFQGDDPGPASDPEVFIMRPDGTDRTQLTFNDFPDISPSWQPLPVRAPDPGYPRPKGASPLRMPLVPAYRQCEAPNRTHGPPLGFGSCNPPLQESDYLTVGTPDANGASARSIGYVRLGVRTGNPSTPWSEADFRIRTEITDVRCRIAFSPCRSGQYSDYTGELQGAIPMRITDRLTLPVPGIEAATTQNYLPFTWTIPCAETADPAVGATCLVETTAQAVLPGAVVERMRASWQIERIEIRDGGGDGQAGTDDFGLFATQGLFVP